MKRITVASLSLTLSVLTIFLLTASTNQPSTTINETSTQEVVIEPHEMPASQLKETLIATLTTDATASNKELFFLEHCSISSQLIACLLMATKNHPAARTLLEKKSKLSLDQLQALRRHEATKDVMADLELLEGQKIGAVAQKLVSAVNTLDVSPLNQHAYKRAGYATYYADKKEDFSLDKQDIWEKKQKNVLKVLQEIKPKTVLDIGGNSGWFSRLAATYGARVIATDIDERCIEYQYQAAKDANLPVKPLIHAFEKFNDDTETIRLESDVVLCLAVIHHLVFLGGMTLEKIIERLAKVTKKTLILEFVSLEDVTLQKGLNDPQFFATEKLYNTAQSYLNTYAKEKYNIDHLLILTKSFFNDIKVFESNPKSRCLIILSK